MPKRDYRSPFTRLGMTFAEIEHTGSASFLVHECGFMTYKDWNHRGIRSPYWRLHHNLAPGNGLSCEGRYHALGPDCVVLTPPEVTFDTLGPETVPHLWVHFTPAREYAIRLAGPTSLKITDALRALLRSLVSSFDSADDPGSYERLQHLCKGLLHLAFASLPTEHFHGYSPRMMRLLEHIARYPATDLSNRRLAERVAMGLRTFEQWFKHRTGQSPGSVRIRLTRPSRLPLASAVRQVYRRYR